MRTIRTPLTIVGIVSNVVALVLVGVVLCSEPELKLPTLQQLVDRVKEVAKTRRVTPDDFVDLLGKLKHKSGYEGEWAGEWGQQTEAGKCEYQIMVIVVSSLKKPGNYLVSLNVKHTYSSGPKYIYENIARAIKSGRLFPMEPLVGQQMELLDFDSPK